MDDSSPRGHSAVFGDLRIVNPASDLSFEECSEEKTHTHKSNDDSKLNRDAFEYPTFFRPAGCETSTDHLSRQCLNVGGKRTIKSSESSLQRLKRLVIGSKPKSRQQPLDLRSMPTSCQKRKESPWFKPRQSIRKRFKYHSFPDEIDSFDYNMRQIQKSAPECFAIQPTALLETNQVTDPNSIDFDLAEPVATRSQAYDDRSILNSMFHGNDHDDSFHKERKVFEPLLKPTTVRQATISFEEDRHPLTGSLNVAMSRWSLIKKEERHEPFSMLNRNMGVEIIWPDKTSVPLIEDESSDVRDSVTFVKKPVKNACPKKTIFSLFGCLQSGRRRRNSGRRTNTRRITSKKKGTNTTKGTTQNNDVSSVPGDTNPPVDCSIDDEFSKFQRVSHFDEETLLRELRKLDLLANEAYRTSPDLVPMPVNSQLSAIPEVDEDLTQKSSGTSVHSSIEMSQHMRSDGRYFSSLGAMLHCDKTSVGTEEPNFFPTETRTRQAASPNHEPPYQSDEKGYTIKTKTSHDPVKRDKRRVDGKFRLTGEEITVTSDEDSTSGISDITEDFWQIPVTSPLFKKAMQMFREVAAEEVGRDTDLPDESRDDFDDLTRVEMVLI